MNDKKLYIVYDIMGGKGYKDNALRKQRWSTEYKISDILELMILVEFSPENIKGKKLWGEKTTSFSFSINLESPHKLP